MKYSNAQYTLVASGTYEGVEVAVLEHKHGYTVAITVATESETQDDVDAPTFAFVRSDDKHNKYILQESIFINRTTMGEALDVLHRQTAGH